VIIDIRAALTTGGARVTAARIGQSTGTISSATAAALVLAGVLSVGLFAGTALTVLADHRREAPR
jgi:lipid-binding SYLF domain-containing protein